MGYVTVPNNKITKVITCFVTSIGPEGMFDPKKNVIHARYYKSEGWNEFVETVFHEAAHIEIFDPKKYSYEEDEKKVEKFLDEISQDFCVGQAVSVCHD